MTKQKWIQNQVFYKAGALVWSVLFFVLALRTYFSDSEIWGLTLSQQVFSPHNLGSIYYKLGFHIFAYLSSHFAPTEFAVYQWARVAWAILSLLTIWLMSRLATQVHGKSQWQWPLFIFLITCSLFLNQGFRIRADILCLFFHVLFLNGLWRAYLQGPRKRDFIVLTTLHLLMMSTTPKFIIFTLGQILLGTYWSRSSTKHSRRLLWLLIFTTLMPVALGSAAVLLLAAFHSNQLICSIASAADFFLKSFDTHLVNPLIFSYTDFYHFFKLFFYSHTHAFFLTIWVLVFILTLFKKKKDPTNPKVALNVYSALLFFIIITYNQKLPFFLGAFLTPVLAQAFCLVMTGFENWFPKRSNLLLALVTLAASSNGLINARLNFFFNTNILQRDAIVRLEDYVRQFPQTKFYDIIGLLPRKNKIFAFVGPGEVAQKSTILETVMAADPDLILIVYKFKYLEPEFPPLLQKSWVPVGPDVWVKGRFISLKTTPELFRQTTLIDGKLFWVMPLPQERIIISNSTFKSIQNEIHFLDQNQKVTQSKPVYLAVPQSYLSLVLTNVEPLRLMNPPSLLFRFDTTF